MGLGRQTKNKLTMFNILRFKQLLVTTALLLASVSSFAYDFEVDGIYYNKLSENTVEVTYEKCENNVYSTEGYVGAITIPSSITVENMTYNVVSIGSYAFQNCSRMTSITIPNGITTIGSHTFQGCSSLNSITIPKGITSIGEWTFWGCSGLTSISLPDGISSIGEDAFNGCSSLKSITIPEGVTSIGSSAFYNCKALNTINIPKSVTSIENLTFASSGLTSITIPDGVTKIGDWAFSGCYIKNININSIENWMKIDICDHAFTTNHDIIVNGQKLIEIVIPESITTIGKHTFSGCTCLESITLHKNIAIIGQNAFNGCKNVKKIVCLGDTPPVCGADALEGISRTDCTLYVPETSGSNYHNSTPWNEFTNIVGGDTPQTCEAPTITFDNDAKKLVFNSATEGAKYHCTITSDDMMSDKTIDSEVTMTGIYNITAYASADGMYNSEKTTAKLCWVSAAIESDGILTAKADRGVIVSSIGNQINISGTVNGETIEIYNVGGSKLKSVNATGDNTTINGLQSGNVYIIKIGGTKVKVAM